MSPWLLPFYSFDAERKCAHWLSKLAKQRLRYLHEITKPLLRGRMKAFGMCHHKAAHSRVRGERFLNGRNPALPLCYTTGKSGQNCRPRTMNGIHTPFILDERGRKLTHSYTKGKKKGRLPLKEKAPLEAIRLCPILGHPRIARPGQRCRRQHSAHGGFRP